MQRPPGSRQSALPSPIPWSSQMLPRLPLAIALCRAVGPADSPALDEITARTLSGKDGMRAVLKSVAMSEPFLHKNVKEATEEKH